jgi:hypothetical protein
MPAPRRLGRLAAAAALAASLALSACASIDRSVALSEAAVVPITAGEAADVPAAALAEAMLRAGFTPEEIIRHGPALHNALATSGGAQVRQARVVSAVFAIHSDALYVTSRTRGTFMQPLHGELHPDRPPPGEEAGADELGAGILAPTEPETVAAGAPL